MIDGYSPKFIEFKSYSDASKIPINQFLAYISRVANISELKYYFNINKLSISKAKEGMKKFIMTNKQVIFDNTTAAFRTEHDLISSSSLTDEKIVELVDLFVNN